MPRAPDDPLFWSAPVALSPQCHFIGSCARFDGIALKVGTVTVFRGNQDSRFAALSGLVHASISFLDLAEFGAAFGGYMTHDEAGSFHYASMPMDLQGKLRLFPAIWKKSPDSGALQVALAYQRTLVSEKLGADSSPGFDTNTVTLLASRSFGPVDIDVGLGAIFGGGAPDLRRAVQVTGSAALRLFGLAKPLTPDEQLRVMVQVAYRFSLPGDGLPSDGYVLLGVEENTHSGYRIGLAAGPYMLGSRTGGLGMLTFSVAWGPRYQNPLAEYIASKPPWIPKVWMDLWHVDPVLEADGCVWTDPGFIRRVIKCVGHPDPKDSKTILLDDGQRLAAGTHVWIRNDGMLITQWQEEVGQLDADTAKRAIAWQLFSHALRDRSDEKACKQVRSILEDTQQSNVFALAEVMQAAPGLAMADWLNRVEACGVLGAGGGILPPIGALGPRGGMGHMPASLGKGNKEGEAEHAQPATLVRAPLSSDGNSHVFYGEVDAKTGKATGWHYEPSANPTKGTYVIEETRSALDKNGVYEANVMIDGTKKGARSTFFPKHWTEAEVQDAIHEAYERRTPTGKRPNTYEGRSNSGIRIEMWLDSKGGIDSAFPLMESAK